MDRKDFMVWLRKRRFERPVFDVYKAGYQGGTVRVDVGQSTAETVFIADGNQTPLASYRIRNLVLDRFGMIQGAGLTEYFKERVFRGEPYPDWFTGEYRKVTNAEFKRSSVGEQRPIPYGRGLAGDEGRLHVAQWAARHGFRRVGNQAFEARYKDGTVRIVLTQEGVLTSRFGLWGTAEHSHVVYAKLRIDNHGMLRGANLVTPFMEEVMDGSPFPTWFPENFILAYSEQMEAAGIRATVTHDHRPSQRKPSM